MKQIILIVSAVLILSGSNCEILTPQDRQLSWYELPSGNQVELLPMEIPWIVVADDSLDDPSALDEVIDLMNGWFAPHVLFTGGVDSELFNQLWYLDPEDRQGYILFWVGALPDPEWEFYGGEDGPGGIANLYIDDYGVIRSADVVIDSEHAYHRDTFVRRSIHELGHTLGFEHDDYSLDLNSCMSSPPVPLCRILQSDVDYWIDAWSNG